MIGRYTFGGGSGSSNTHGWQLILADLALILFLVTLSALAAEGSDGEPADQNRTLAPQISAAQALFRPSPFGPSLADWLSERPYDPRATLTIFAQHTGGDSSAIWERAQVLAGNARERGYSVRVVITHGDISDVYASLAYDAPGAGL